MAVFPKKFASIAQRPRALPPSPHKCHHVQNVESVQNVQMALKWLYFFKKKKNARIVEWLILVILFKMLKTPTHVILFKILKMFKMSFKWC